MLPIAATLIAPNFEYFVKLIKLEEEFNRKPLDLGLIFIEDKALTKDKKYPLLVYILKKHRLTNGKDEEILQIIKYLQEKNSRAFKE